MPHFDEFRRVSPKLLHFGLRRREVAERLHDPVGVVPGHPVKGGEFDVFQAFPRAAMMIDLRFG